MIILKHSPSSLTNIVTTNTNALFGYINEFETKSRKLGHEFKSKMCSLLIVEGVECFYDAYDKGDYDCLHDLLIPGVKHELCFIDDGEPFEISCYDDIMEILKQ